MDSSTNIIILFMLTLRSGVSAEVEPPTYSVETGASKEFWQTSKFHYLDFQIKVLGGTTECFYQYLKANASLTVIWHVMSSTYSGELAALVSTTHMGTGEKIYEGSYGQMGQDYQTKLNEGTYQVCVDNENSYSTKRVYIWIDYYLQLDWQAVIEDDLDVKSAQLKVDIIRSTMVTIQNRLADISHFQAIYRERNVADETAVVQVMRLIDNSCTLAMLIIITTGLLQICFLRSLFKISSKTQASI